MKRLKCFTDFEKEEQWLRQLAQQGWQLVRRTAMGSYVFEPCTPGSRLYRIDFRQFTKKADYDAYLALFYDSGWALVYGSKDEGSQYFLPMRPEALPDIFSDAHSRAGRYKRLSEYYFTFAAIFTCCFSPLFINNNYSNIVYQTPHLWEKTGLDFWTAFLFETPFVLLRSAGAWLPAACLLLFIVLAIVARRKYRLASRGSMATA